MSEVRNLAKRSDERIRSPDVKQLTILKKSAWHMIYVSGVVCEGSSESRLRKAFEKEKHKKREQNKATYCYYIIGKLYLIYS